MDWVALARTLATEAHAGQIDKAGQPYIGHVARVAAAVRGDDDAEVVAWLHDVAEDCPAFCRADRGISGAAARGGATAQPRCSS